MFLPGALLVVIGYALFYTGIGKLSSGAFTGGNTQGLSTSLGLDALAARGAASWKGGGGGPITSAPAPAPGAGVPTGSLNNPGSVSA